MNQTVLLRLSPAGAIRDDCGGVLQLTFGRRNPCDQVKSMGDRHDMATSAAERTAFNGKLQAGARKPTRTRAVGSQHGGNMTDTEFQPPNIETVDLMQDGVLYVTVS